MGEIVIEWTDAAKERLQEIFDYYEMEAGSHIAQKIIKKILERTRVLAQHPEIGPKERLLEKYEEKFRYLIEGNYKIVYWLVPGKVMILTVFNCRQDPEKLLKEAEK